MSHAVTSSGQLSVGTTTVQAKPCILTAVMLLPGSAASTIVVYDNASAGSGKILVQLVAPASTATNMIDFKHPIDALNGLTIVISGTSASGSINYARTY